MFVLNISQGCLGYVGAKEKNMRGSLEVENPPGKSFRRQRGPKRILDVANEDVFATSVSREKRYRKELQSDANQENSTQHEKEILVREEQCFSCERRTFQDSVNVVICSETQEREAHKYADIFTSKGQTTEVLVCRGCYLFNIETLPTDHPMYMYLLVDSQLVNMILPKKSLVESVDDFFEAFARAGSRVYLINKMADSHKFKVLFYQLPEGCAKIFTEAVVSLNCHQESDSDKEGVPVKQSICDGEIGKFDDSTLIAEPVTDQTLVNQVTHPEDEDVASDENHSEESDEAISWSAIDGQHEQTEPSTECLQVGSHCKMKISAVSKQLVLATQVGSQNIMNIKIVPSTSASSMVVKLTSDPHNPELEELLVTELNSKTDTVNISLKCHDTTIVGVRRGSVIIEMDVKPEREMSPHWICEVLRLMFQGILTPDVVGGTHFDADVNLLSVIPKDQLGQYVFLKDPERIHLSCVDKAKYDELAQQLEKTKSKLKGSESETINIINPKLSSGGSLILVLKCDLP